MAWKAGWENKDFFRRSMLSQIDLLVAFLLAITESICIKHIFKTNLHIYALVWWV